MIDYDSFWRCHLTDIFFAFHVGAKELRSIIMLSCLVELSRLAICALCYK